jgi:hypothetical protein
VLRYVAKLERLRAEHTDGTLVELQGIDVTRAVTRTGSVLTKELRNQLRSAIVVTLFPLYSMTVASTYS